MKQYLMSIDVNPGHPQRPVPGMDKNQKRHFPWNVEHYTVKKRILYYLHQFVDKTIGYERGMFERFSCHRFYSTCNYFVVVIIRVHVTISGYY